MSYPEGPLANNYKSEGASMPGHQQDDYVYSSYDSATNQGERCVLAHDPILPTDLAIYRYQAFNDTGEQRELDEAANLTADTVSTMRTEDSVECKLVRGFENLLSEKSNQSGKITDLNKVIEYKSQAVASTSQDHPDMPALLSTLGTSLLTRFRELEGLADINKSIEYQLQAVSLASPCHPDLPVWLNNLASSFRTRFERLGNLPDIDKAIEFQSQAVSLTPQGDPHMPTQLNNLGRSLHARFKRTGELADLEKAIEYKSQAVAVTDRGNSVLPTMLIHLGISFKARFERLGELPDLDKSIAYLRQAVSLIPQDHPDMSTSLCNLGTSVQIRYQRLGELVDLDNAIAYQSQAVTSTPQGHSNASTRFNNLGGSFLARFQRLGEGADLNKAITYLSQAVELIPQDHPDRPAWLSNFGRSLQTRYTRSSELEDLDKAIEYGSQAISLTPQGHSSMPSWLDNLGTSLQIRFQRYGELTDLEKATMYYTRAVSLTPQGHPSMPSRLSSLGHSLTTRFERLGELADLDKAIQYNTQAISLTAKGHSPMPLQLRILAYAHETRFKSSHLVADIKMSLKYLRQGAESPFGSPSFRFQTALRWARLSVKHRRSSALTAYQLAISLLPQIVWLGSALASRYRHIVNVGQVTTEAAAAAIKMNDFSLALEWLEEGRSIVWKQMLQLRTPYDTLAAADPKLAQELNKVACDLDEASSPSLADKYALINDHSFEQAAQQHRRLAEKWEKLLAKARSLPGFAGFLRSMKASELMGSASSGPVVVVNVFKIRCDALVIRPGVNKILHVPLKLSYDKVVETRVQLDQLVRSQGLTQRKPKISKRDGKDPFENTLKMLWAEVVMPVLVSLGYMEQPSVGELPHITWCTTGPLSFLPLHAAGDYDSGEMIFKYAVSSYTPTLSVLLSPRSSYAFSGLLAVGQSSSLGLPPLPGTVKELNQIVETFKKHTVTRLDDSLATPATVLTGIEEHSWVHLACHASQDTANPLQSAFYLHNGTLDLSTITRKQLKNADFAFLSACQTATGDRNLSEEAVHLAAGMLMAGYSTVIATMWSIGDDDAPLIAEEVYGHLIEGGTPDARRAAVAVHKATTRLREKVGIKAIAKWAPYIHIGL